MTLESSGLLLAPLGSECAVYDLVTHEVSIIHPLAALLLESPREEWSVLADEVADTQPGVTADSVVESFASIESELTAAGLLGERPEYTPIPSVHGPVEECPQCHVGTTFALLDHRMAFRGLDPDLVARVEALVTLPTPLCHSRGVR